MDFEQLKKDNLLTISPSGYVCVKPIDQYSFTSYPIDIYDCILITQDEYVGLLERRYMFNEALTGVIDYVKPVYEEIGENGLTSEE